LHPITIPPRTIPLAPATIVPARILAVAVTAIGVETVVAIAVVVAAGDAGADVIVAGAHRVARAAQGADAICPRRNTLPRRVANPAGMTIAADNRAATTIAVRKFRVVRRLRPQSFPKKRLFSRVNRWQNIAPSLPLRPRLFPVLNVKHTKSRTPSKKFRRAHPAICQPPPQAAAAFLAASPAGCHAGF
jgi:hypothetical protein